MWHPRIVQLLWIALCINKERPTTVVLALHHFFCYWHSAFRLAKLVNECHSTSRVISGKEAGERSGEKLGDFSPGLPFKTKGNRLCRPLTNSRIEEYLGKSWEIFPQIFPSRRKEMQCASSYDEQKVWGRSGDRFFIHEERKCRLTLWWAQDSWKTWGRARGLVPRSSLQKERKCGVSRPSCSEAGLGSRLLFILS